MNGARVSPGRRLCTGGTESDVLVSALPLPWSDAVSCPIYCDVSRPIFESFNAISRVKQGDLRGPPIDSHLPESCFIKLSEAISWRFCFLSSTNTPKSSGGLQENVSAKVEVFHHNKLFCKVRWTTVEVMDMIGGDRSKEKEMEWKKDWRKGEKMEEGEVKSEELKEREGPCRSRWGGTWMKDLYKKPRHNRGKGEEREERRWQINTVW